MTRESSFRFRPKARILRLLGDQLIGSSRLAIFELVKNAYDADAEEVVITLSDLGRTSARIVVRDNGDGMDAETIRDVWFVPGADHRERQRREGRRSKIFHRLPLGEKGLGRFAVHKLGDRIELITRSRDENIERVVGIDWGELLDDRFLENLMIDVETRKPAEFIGKVGEAHGTQITITALRQREWTRGDLRRLYRQVTSICSPFVASREFSVRLEVPGRTRDLSGLPSVGDILESAFWHYTFKLDENGFTWTYEFTNRIAGVSIQNRILSGTNELLVLDDQSDEAAEEAMPRSQRRKDRKNVVAADSEFLEGIGPVEGEFFIFDRDKEVLQRMPSPDLVTRYLNENGGVRVYRDAIRVYNYGEKGDDWLGLDLRRVNQPTRRVSRNVIVGAVNLGLEESTGLVEKTNREGFVENESYSRLRRVVLAALTAMEAERDPDKERLRQLLGSPKGTQKFDAEPPIEALRREAKRQGVDAALEPYILRIQKEFEALKDTLVHSGMSGIGLAVVFHEIDRGVRELYAALKGGAAKPALEQKAKELSMLLDGFSTLLRRSDRRPMSASDLVRNARDISAARFRFHHVRFDCPLLDGTQEDFEATMARGLMLGAMTNLFDNSLYWLRARWPDEQEDSDTLQRKLYVGTSLDLEGGPAIIVADNGPGFRDDPDLLTKPFFTRRPDGMGLGLYYVRLAMEIGGGSIQFPEPGDVDLPDGYDGAVVALVFGGGERKQ
jgi:signal transduction histidine kinase